MVGCTNCASDIALQEQGLSPNLKRVLWAALIINASMFFIEIAASQTASSVALQADALDFFGDSANYAISLFVLGMALHLRARASLIKGLTMGAFGLFVIANASYRAFIGSTPDGFVIGSIAFLALIANVFVAFLLYRYRAGDSNMRSVWLCSRNDAIGNVAVIAAGVGVFASGSHWPDLLVAGIIATLSLLAAYQIINLARIEMRSPIDASNPKTSTLSINEGIDSPHGELHCKS